jgi:hypothetical protein
VEAVAQEWGGAFGVAMQVDDCDDVDVLDDGSERK